MMACFTTVSMEIMQMVEIEESLWKQALGEKNLRSPAGPATGILPVVLRNI